MMGKTDGVICSTVRSTLGGNSDRLAPMRFQMSVSARRMSVPGAKSMEISLPPRMVLERTRDDAEDAADRAFQRPGDLELHLGNIPVRNASHDGDAREGHLGIDAAGHARGAVDAAGSQEATGQDHRADIRAGLGRQVHHAGKFSIRSYDLAAYGFSSGFATSSSSSSSSFTASPV